MIQLKCPHCSKGIRVADEHAGKKVRCPGCKEPLTAPADSTAVTSKAPAKSATPSQTTAPSTAVGKMPPKPDASIQASAPPPLNRRPPDAGDEDVVAMEFVDEDDEDLAGRGRRREKRNVRRRGDNVVCLIGALKPYIGAEWELRLTRDSLELVDEENEVVTDIPDTEVAMRIHFPSFWASVRNLTIADTKGALLQFEPKAEAVEGVRKLVDRCLYRDWEGAARAMRGKALRDFLIGGGLLFLGVIITIGSCLAAAAQGGMYVVTTGLLAGGVAGIIRAFYWLWKAARLTKTAAESD